MDKIIEKSWELKRNLDETELFKEYKRVKKAVEDCAEIKTLKRDIVRAKNEGRLLDHKALMDKYNNHPLILNLNDLEEEVADYLKEISNLLN